MLTRIQHAAIVSENFVREAKFYEAVFGMKRSKPGSEEEQKAIRTNYAVSISDTRMNHSVSMFSSPVRGSRRARRETETESKAPCTFP